MQVLHLPPRHLWRITAIAALLAVTLTSVTFLAIGRIGSNGRSSPASGSADAAPAPALQTDELVRVPFAPRTVFNQPLQNPVGPLFEPTTAGPAAFH